MRSKQGQRLAALLAQADGPGSAASSPLGLQARHCWVIDPPGWPGRWPGLLHRWCRTDSGWSGQVTMAVVHEGRQILVHAEIPAAWLRPL